MSDEISFCSWTVSIKAEVELMLLFSVSQPFSLRGTPLTYKKFWGTPLLYKKIPRNPFATQKNYGQPLIYWYKAFLYKLGNCRVKMTQIPSEHIKKEWIKTEMFCFFQIWQNP